MSNHVATEPQRGSTLLLAHLALLDRLTGEADGDPVPARERVAEALGPELAERLTRGLSQSLPARLPLTGE